MFVDRLQPSDQRIEDRHYAAMSGARKVFCQSMKAGRLEFTSIMALFLFCIHHSAFLLSSCACSQAMPCRNSASDLASVNGSSPTGVRPVITE